MKTHYSAEELKEFELLILHKLQEADELLISLEETLANKNNGTDNTSWTFNMMEDGQSTMSKEETAILAQKQSKFVIALHTALKRIENKTYGICYMTGQLIPRERLLAVPHTTTVINAKQKS